MDPFSLIARCLASYLVLLVLLRLAGKHTIKQGPPFDFVLAFVVGDLVDNAIWGEVPFIQFVVASSTLLLTRLLMTAHRSRAASLPR